MINIYTWITWKYIYKSHYYIINYILNKHFLGKLYEAITQSDISICGNENISSFQVPVYNLILMEVNQRLQRLFTHNPDLRLCQWALQLCRHTHTCKMAVNRVTAKQAHFISSFNCKWCVFKLNQTNKLQCNRDKVLWLILIAIFSVVVYG